ncbi:MAG TPA: imelysin family protein [Candidatus Eisenbacteria bacterium]|nr:imelysin family protein [Candidatus Eisenbacteria bacterium]
MIGWLIIPLAALAPFVAPAATPPARAAAEQRVRAALDGYAHLAGRAYGESLREAETLKSAIAQMLAHPSQRSLGRAREAWIACRDAYGRTETFRFSGGPIDDRHPVTGIDGPETRINSWPIDEAFLDYVAGSPRSGIIGDLSSPLTEALLVRRNTAEDETQVTLGYHAIEFLLWGQDRRRDGPGQRPFSDYLPGHPVRERRRRCLSLIADRLVRDLATVKVEWDAGPRRYVDHFRALDPKDALGHALSGPATLAAFELASERIGVALSSGSQEDEQSCFSDNTHRDLASNIEGIAQVLEGDAGTPGLMLAVEAIDPALAEDARERLRRARELVYAVPPPFDAILLAPEDDPRRRTLQALAGELLGLAGDLQRAGAAFGARVVIGGGG